MKLMLCCCNISHELKGTAMKIKRICVGYMTKSVTYILQMLCAGNVNGPPDISLSNFSPHVMKQVESSGSN
jgi:hypothetical protein